MSGLSTCRAPQIWRRPWAASARIVLCGAFFLSACSSDIDGVDCTRIGCSNQLTIRAMGSSNNVIELVKGALIIDGETLTFDCSAPGSTDKVACTSAGLVVQTASTDVVVASISGDDMKAQSVTLTPAYAAVRPNGPGCSPVCQQAIVDVQLGGGLSDATGADAGSAPSDSGAVEADVADVSAADVGSPDAGLTDAGAADTNSSAPTCCKGATDCPKNNACVSGGCKDLSQLKAGLCWRDSDCKSGACQDATVCACGLDCLAPDKPGTCPSTSTCDTITPTEYGLCEMIIGVGWDGQKCVTVSGCSCKADCAKFFKTKAACEQSCVKAP